MSDSMSEQSSFASDGSRDLSVSENDDRSPSPPKSTRPRPSRQRTLPLKLREAELDGLEEITLDMTRSVVVKCSQTGKLHQVKVKDLSREDCEPLTKEDLVKGSELMMEMKGKVYPVQFMQTKEKGGPSEKVRFEENVSETSRRDKTSRKEKSSSKSRKRAADSDGGLRDTTNVTEILAKAKNKPPKKQKCLDADQDDGTMNTKKTSSWSKKGSDDDQAASSALDYADKDLLVNLAGKVENMERMMVKMMEILKSGIRAGGVTVGGDGAVKQENDECTVSGVNVMRIPSRDAYAFGLQLLNILFTKEELAESLLFKSKKSKKPGLEQGRVEQMLKLIERRFGNDWDLRTLTQKVNQKCRDSAKDMQVELQE